MEISVPTSYKGCFPEMKIAMIGTRGVPASYGGFETCVEELGKRLVGKGHQVTVYCRNNYYDVRPPQFLGMDLVYLPSLRRKSLDTLSHTFLSVTHALSQNFDVFMVFNAANSLTLVLPRLLGKKIVINTDGLEWKRGKWGVVGQRFYKFAEFLSTRLANRIVADSAGIQAYYREMYRADSTNIAYGAHVNTSRDPGLLDSLGLTPNGYFLQITRFEPENNPLLTIRAFKRLKTEKKLVVVGGVPYDSEYSRLILAEAGGNVMLPGFIYDKALLNELWCNCFAYIHGNEVGGTNPALLQSMASGCFTIAIDVPFSHDVLSDGGIFFQKDVESLSKSMLWALENCQSLRDYKLKAVKRIEEHYCWDMVADAYESLFQEVVA
jgi:glycosyltransferase involved in cell wall biosynthesis